MLYFRLVWCFMAVLVVLAWSCATDGRTRALDQAASAGWRRVDFEGQTFTLAGWLKHAGGQASCSALVVYIEDRKSTRLNSSHGSISYLGEEIGRASCRERV